jgi:hypothetical protein
VPKKDLTGTILRLAGASIYRLIRNLHLGPTCNLNGAGGTDLRKLSIFPLE